MGAKLGRLSPAASRAVGIAQADLNPRFLCSLASLEGFCWTSTLAFPSPLQLGASLPPSSWERINSGVLPSLLHCRGFAYAEQRRHKVMTSSLFLDKAM